MTRVRRSTPIRLSLLALAAAAAACGGGGGQQPAKPEKTIIQNKGSDTMVNVAQVWAEECVTAAAPATTPILVAWEGWGRAGVFTADFNAEGAEGAGGRAALFANPLAG